MSAAYQDVLPFADMAPLALHATLQPTFRVWRDIWPFKEFFGSMSERRKARPVRPVSGRVCCCGIVARDMNAWLLESFFELECVRFGLAEGRRCESVEEAEGRVGWQMERHRDGVLALVRKVLEGPWAKVEEGCEGCEGCEGFGGEAWRRPASWGSGADVLGQAEATQGERGSGDEESEWDHFESDDNSSVGEMLRGLELGLDEERGQLSEQPASHSPTSRDAVLSPTLSAAIDEVGLEPEGYSDRARRRRMLPVEGYVYDFRPSDILLEWKPVGLEHREMEGTDNETVSPISKSRGVGLEVEGEVRKAFGEEGGLNESMEKGAKDTVPVPTQTSPTLSQGWELEIAVQELRREVLVLKAEVVALRRELARTGTAPDLVDVLIESQTSGLEMLRKLKRDWVVGEEEMEKGRMGRLR